MKFLVDAQLPRSVAQWLHDAGHDARHTLELPLGNRTPDAQLIALALQEGRIVVTKDADFVHSFLLHGEPSLLLVSTGNIANAALERAIRRNMRAIEDAFRSVSFVELTTASLVLHQ